MTEPQRAKDNVGAMNFLYSEAILKVWNANPKYETIHKLRDAVNFHSHIPQIAEVTKVLDNSGVDTADSAVALELAFLEFYLRVGQHYEREKRDESGDLPGYETAIKHLNDMAQANFNRRIGFTPKEAK